MLSDWDLCMQPDAWRTCLVTHHSGGKGILPIDVVRRWPTWRIARNTIGYPLSLVDPHIVNIHTNRKDEMFEILLLEAR